MRSQKIEGIGGIFGGECDSVSIEGVGTVKSDLKTDEFHSEGVARCKGDIIAKHVHCEGTIRFFKGVKIDRMECEGLARLDAKVSAIEELTADGIVCSQGEISGERITLTGCSSVAALTGDKITLRYKDVHRQGRNFAGVSGLFLGRSIDGERHMVDRVECTSLEAERLRAKVVRAGSVVLRDGCEIDLLECDGEVDVDETCIIKNRNGEQKQSGAKKEEEPMGVTEVLERVRKGVLTVEEAEMLLSAIKGTPEVKNESGPAVGWPDDDKLRIVVYRGRRLLRKGEGVCEKLTMEYQGEALDVECMCSLTCGPVKGKASAGNKMNVQGDVGGGVSAGNSVTVESGDVSGNISAGSSVTVTGDVEGNISAGGGVRINK